MIVAPASLLPPEQHQLVRSYCQHVPRWQRFQTTLIEATQQIAVRDSENTHPYQRQYSHVYHQRLQALGPRCWRHPVVQEKLNQTARPYACAKRIIELQENIPSVAVGTIVKERSTEGDKLETKILPDDSTSTCRTTDALFLEDESGRVALNTPQIHRYATGVVAAMQGVVRSDGVMSVEAIYHATANIALADADISENANHENNNDDAPLILLLSGLQCGNAAISTLPRELLLSFLEGSLGAEKMARRVCHVILAGGLCHASGNNTTALLDSVAAVRELDAFVFSIAALGLPVDILPGRDDPTSANWPQRPLHRSLLKQSIRFFQPLVHSTPNPYAGQFKLNQHHDDNEETDTKILSVLGTDGLNIHDLQQHVLNDDETAPIAELDALQQTLLWSHVCPTGPNTVPTAPHAETDPMVIDTLEGDEKTNGSAFSTLYFSGNAREVATRLVKVQTCSTTNESGNDNLVRLVCIPKFADTNTAVLVDLRTMETELLKFESSLGD